MNSEHNLPADRLTEGFLQEPSVVIGESPSDGRELPDAPGIWWRDGETWIVRNRNRTLVASMFCPDWYKAETEYDVPCEFREDMKGGWHPASAAREDAQAARLAELEAELAKVREENAALTKQWNDIDHRNEQRHREWNAQLTAARNELTALRSAIGQKAAEWRAKPWEGDRTAGAFDCADELEALAKEGK